MTVNAVFVYLFCGMGIEGEDRRRTLLSLVRNQSFFFLKQVAGSPACPPE